jgi:hypothetical protein
VSGKFRAFEVAWGDLDGFDSDRSFISRLMTGGKVQFEVTSFNENSDFIHFPTKFINKTAWKTKESC